MDEGEQAAKEIEDVLDDLEMLLKRHDVGEVLAGRGVNISLAIVASDGLRAYIKGDKARAVEDLGTAAEEIASRMKGSA
ncbi:MAG: hypothetical protein KC657_03165 [Myxococcales bacterium]|nr:hypothetical protein [Myxococcales bacterium]